ncbi:MAG: polysaccharide deacetylase family protein [Acidobacteriota bacterium]|nr:polysaccharide deacetylase family protein [Acidobacteriota bacterium]
MNKIRLPAIFLLVQLFLLGVGGLSAQQQQATKEIAVTIDDLPLNGQQFEAARLRKMTDKFLFGLKKYQIPAVGFVNESLLYMPDETDARIAILKSWTDAGVELGNHTFSHLGFRNASLADYQDDFIRGEAVTKMLLKPKGLKPRYFRHPFLQMGANLETEKSFEDFIARRGYKIAPITVDTMDWMFLAAYAKARAAKDKPMMKRVADEYLKYVAVKFDYCEKISGEMFARPVRHILLLHANELNADNFDELVNVIKSKGYRFITLERALEDPIYQFPDKYNATSDWLSMWAFSKGKKFDAPPQPPDFIQKIFNGK